LHWSNFFFSSFFPLVHNHLLCLRRVENWKYDAYLNRSLFMKEILTNIHYWIYNWTF
jgi:hypothetical protein